MSTGILVRTLILGISMVLSATADAGAIRHKDGVGNTVDWKPTGKGYGLPNKNSPTRATPNSNSNPKIVVTKAPRIAPTATGYGIAYHGGKVMAGPSKIYYIWYGNWTGNTATTILTDLASTIGGSPYLNITTTYSTSTTLISNSVAYGGATTDSYSNGTVLSDLGVYKVVAAAINSKRLPSDPNGIYFVLSSKDVGASSGFCSSYCAWHSTGGIGINNIRYAFVGNTDRCPSVCAPQTISPNGNAGADGMANNIAHELVETITDPEMTAWYDSFGYEVSDKCSWKFGTKYTAPNGSSWNVKLGTRNYYLQQNWVNVRKLTGTTVSNGYCDIAY